MFASEATAVFSDLAYYLWSPQDCQRNLPPHDGRSPGSGNPNARARARFGRMRRFFISAMATTPTQPSAQTPIGPVNAVNVILMAPNVEAPAVVAVGAARTDPQPMRLRSPRGAASDPSALLGAAKVNTLPPSRPATAPAVGIVAPAPATPPAQ